MSETTIKCQMCDRDWTPIELVISTDNYDFDELLCPTCAIKKLAEFLQDHY